MGNVKRVRIVSDGTSSGTKVFGPTGEELTSLISKISWSVEPDSIARAEITFIDVDLDVAGETE